MLPDLNLEKNKELFAVIQKSYFESYCVYM